MSPRRSGDKLLRLQTGEGSESDPRRSEDGSSAGPSASDTEREELIDEAMTLFSSRYARAVTAEEARQMAERLTAFFSLLMEWDRRQREGLDRAA